MNNDLTKLIDHTNLKIDASRSEIEQLVREAKSFGFNSICVRPQWLSEFAAQVKTSAVISFPTEIFQVESEDDKESVKAIIGGFSLEEKNHETQDCLLMGALELDPVIHLSKLNSFEEELEIYKDTILKHSSKQIFLKPIFSCEILNDEELEFSLAKYCEFASKNKNDRIRYCYKNSTGFIKTQNPNLLKPTSPNLISKIVTTLDKFDKARLISIKAAGGIKSLTEIQFYHQLCAGRLSHIGTSSGVKIFS